MFKFIHHFLLIIIVFIIQISSDDLFDCTGYEDDSFHPVYDADDCRHYWHCIYVNTVYMHAVKRVCPAGTEFDIHLRQCETSSEVDCRLVQSPHGPRSTSTTREWKMIYSKLFSRIQMQPTMPYLLATRPYSMFNLDEPLNIETTTEIETTEMNRVLKATAPKLSIEQLSKTLQALITNRRKQRNRLSGARFFQPGEPENESDMYTSVSPTTKRRTRRTRPTTQTTTTTQSPLTAEATTVIITTATTTMKTTTLSTTTIITSSIDTTQLTTSMIPIEMSTLQPRMIWNGESRRRRQNMTLYILTSDDHKIRQFPVNHTRGILINCNQLRRRLLGRRRRTRDTSLTTPITTFNSLIPRNQLSKIRFHINLFLLTIVSCTIKILNT